MNKSGTPKNLKPFKKGQCGNPKGRPPGVVSIEKQIREAMKVELTQFDPVTGKSVTKTAEEFMYVHLAAKAAKDGDLSAIEKIFERTEGKAIARQETKEVENWQDDFMDVDDQ